MPASCGNRLLDALSAGSRELVVALAKEVALPLRTQLYWPAEMPRYAYFMISGIASVVAGLNDGGSTEVAVIGREGLIGALHILGPIAPMTECFMQVAGSAYRIPLGALHELFRKEEEIRERILEFVQGAEFVYQPGGRLQQAARGRTSLGALAADDQRPHR